MASRKYKDIREAYEILSGKQTGPGGSTDRSAHHARPHTRHEYGYQKYRNLHHKNRNVSILLRGARGCGMDSEKVGVSAEQYRVWSLYSFFLYIYVLSSIVV